jgi:[acyl-carrier-protein] S-malonyltransferase
VNNADAILLTNAEKIKSSLIKQLSRPLLWEDSIRKIVDGGIDTFIEVGPGKVLCGLIRRIEPSAKLFNVEDTESLNRAVEAVKN